VSIETRERTIGEHTYRVTQLGTKRGSAMLVKLVKLLGPGCGSFIGGLGRAPSGNSGEWESALALGLGDALHDLATRLDEAQFAAVCDEFAKQTAVVLSAELEPRLSDIFDDHFAGKYDVMLRWLRFCMEINFSSFFGAGSTTSSTNALMNLLKGLSASRFRPVSTGTSTESPRAGATTTPS
jgi:hypothetical protein